MPLGLLPQTPSQSSRALGHGVGGTTVSELKIARNDHGEPHDGGINLFYLIALLTS